MSASSANAAAETSFRFRFVVRGEQIDELLRLAVLSLERCHPQSGVVVVDANDQPSVDPHLFGLTLHHDVVHLPPGDDAVARALGRGSRQHLFHWRHSPEVRAVLPAFVGFDVHADADLLFLRPLDLAALAGPLRAGRIAAAIDESTLDHYAAIADASVVPAPVEIGGGPPCGPMWQTGLIFTNPADDGGFYDLVWEAACQLATSGALTMLPDDDMALVAALLGYGGDLWSRALPLGHDWNYITDAVKDPGIFGRVAHYGGRRAKAHLLTRTTPLIPGAGVRPGRPWGTMRHTVTMSCDAAGPARGSFDRPLIDSGGPPTELPLPLPLPLCLTWPVPHSADKLSITAAATLERNPDDGPSAGAITSLHVYTDGRLRARQVISGDGASLTVDTGGSATVTIIAIGERPGLALRHLHVTTPGASR